MINNAGNICLYMFVEANVEYRLISNIKHVIEGPWKPWYRVAKFIFERRKIYNLVLQRSQQWKTYLANNI